MPPGGFPPRSALPATGPGLILTRPGGPPGGGAHGESDLTLFRRLYRVFRWAVLIVLGTALILILWTAPPPQVVVDPEAPQRLERKLRLFEADARLGLSHPLRLDEAEVNNWMQTSLAQAAERAPRPAAGFAPSASNTDPNASTDLTVEEVQSNVRDVKVHMAGDQIIAYVLFDLYGKDLSLTLEGRLPVQDGYLRLPPTRLMLGSLPIPQATVGRAVSSLFDFPENRERFRLPPDILGLEGENSELVITWR